MGKENGGWNPVSVARVAEVIRLRGTIGNRRTVEKIMYTNSAAPKTASSVKRSFPSPTRLLFMAPVTVLLFACGSTSNVDNTASDATAPGILVTTSLPVPATTVPAATAPDTPDTIAPDTTTAAEGDGHNSQNSLDWVGAYVGRVPCADCPGIDTVLVLNKDLSYSLTRLYVDRADDATQVSNGAFTWFDGSVIQLGGLDGSAEPTRYRVEEGRLRQLDLAGVEITGTLSDQYVLAKQPAGFVPPAVTGQASIEGTTWQLVQLNGRDVAGTADTHMLRLENGKLAAKAGCNQLVAGYTLGADGSLKVGPVAGTRMLCENMADEQALIEVLGRTTSVALFTSNLTLTDGSTDLALFTPVQ